MFFTLPEDARWNADRQAVEFGAEIGECRGVVRVPRRVLQRLLPERRADQAGAADNDDLHALSPGSSHARVCALLKMR